jgi:hypothetical protein
MPFDEKEFERQEDARTLIRSVEIQSDSKRLKAAQKEMTKMEAEAKKASLDRKIAKKLKSL